MHYKLLIGTAIGVFLLAPAPVEAACCDQKGHTAQHQCCKDHHEATAVEPLLEMDPQLNPAPPVRQAVEVWFQRPVLVGRAILQGRYVIEHDNERMARGEPCTHLYAYGDRATPVATFECTHLERGRASRHTVSLATTSDGSMQRLTEFQFAGESFAHGYPSVR